MGERQNGPRHTLEYDALTKNRLVLSEKLTQE